ncbi:MAG: ABC transporter permease [Phycisphaeraceae bacterium]
MTLLILRRLLQLPLILAVIFTATFVLAWVIPGNPLQRTDGPRPSPAVAEAMQRQYNLHSPWAFASSYLTNLFTEGDMGPSLVYANERVTGILARSLPVSALLGVAALAVALFLGTVAGVVGALRPGSSLDLASLAVALVGVSLPNFVTGSLLLVLFAGLLPLLPVGGWGGVEHLILPAVTLGVMPAAYIARLVRLGLADTMSSDFIRTARAKGLSYRRALFGHALKVAYLPVLSFLGPASASVLTGSFVVEQVFNVPGLGEHFVQAVLNKDQFLILGVVLTYSTILVLFNLIVDVAYAWFDPRIELG